MDHNRVDFHYYNGIAIISDDSGKIIWQKIIDEEKKLDVVLLDVSITLWLRKHPDAYSI